MLLADVFARLLSFLRYPCPRIGENLGPVRGTDLEHQQCSIWPLS